MHFIVFLAADACAGLTTRDVELRRASVTLLDAPSAAPMPKRVIFNYDQKQISFEYSGAADGKIVLGVAQLSVKSSQPFHQLARQIVSGATAFEVGESTQRFCVTAKQMEDLSDQKQKWWIPVIIILVLAVVIALLTVVIVLCRRRLKREEKANFASDGEQQIYQEVDEDELDRVGCRQGINEVVNLKEQMNARMLGQRLTETFKPSRQSQTRISNNLTGENDLFVSIAAGSLVKEKKAQNDELI